MKSYKHIFFSFLMVCTSFFSEGMRAVRCVDNFLSKGMETMQRIDNSLPCITKVFASTVVILYMLNDCAEDSDSEDMYIPYKKEGKLLNITENSEYKDVEHIIKKAEEEKDILPEDTDNIALFAEIFPLGLLYELSNVP